MSALMAERHDVGRQESLFEGLAPPRPNPWARPPDAPAPDDDAARPEADRGFTPAFDRALPAETEHPPHARREASASDLQGLHGETVRPPETFVGDIAIERR